MPSGAQDIIEQAELGNDLRVAGAAAPGTIMPTTDFTVTSAIPAQSAWIITASTGAAERV
jgi:hypothetical protein